MIRRALLCSFLLVAACASSGTEEPAVVASPGAEASPAVKALPAQTLEPGTCGLFLWTRDEPRHFILFYVAGESTAKAVLGGRAQTLEIGSQEGDVIGQFLSRMILRAEDGQMVSLTLSPGEEIDGGRRVPLARMISRDAEGWEIITPLTGLTACQPE